MAGDRISYDFFFLIHCRISFLLSINFRRVQKILVTLSTLLARIPRLDFYSTPLFFPFNSRLFTTTFARIFVVRLDGHYVSIRYPHTTTVRHPFRVPGRDPSVFGVRPKKPSVPYGSTWPYAQRHIAPYLTSGDR